MSSEVLKPTQKGKAFERLLLAMVAHSPVRPSRAELTESQFLRVFHTDTGKASKSLKSTSDTMDELYKSAQQLTVNEKRNAAKVLGRMVASDALREVLVPNGHDERVNLPEAGLIAVSVSLPVLQIQHRKWIKDGKKGRKPTQEAIAQEIREKSVSWIISECDDAGIPLFLNEIWIVHGSNSIDMLIQVAYRRSRTFMHYVRDVVQQIEGVLGTHTMQISNDLGENDIRFRHEDEK